LLKWENDQSFGGPLGIVGSVSNTNVATPLSVNVAAAYAQLGLGLSCNELT